MKEILVTGWPGWSDVVAAENECVSPVREALTGQFDDRRRLRVKLKELEGSWRSIDVLDSVKGVAKYVR